MNDPIKALLREALARGYTHTEKEQKILDPMLIEAMLQEVIPVYDLQLWGEIQGYINSQQWDISIKPTTVSDSKA